MGAKLPFSPLYNTWPTHPICAHACTFLASSIHIPLINPSLATFIFDPARIKKGTKLLFLPQLPSNIYIASYYYLPNAYNALVVLSRASVPCLCFLIYIATDPTLVDKKKLIFPYGENFAAHAVGTYIVKIKNNYKNTFWSNFNGTYLNK